MKPSFILILALASVALASAIPVEDTKQGNIDINRLSVSIIYYIILVKKSESEDRLWLSLGHGLRIRGLLLQNRVVSRSLDLLPQKRGRSKLYPTQAMHEQPMH